MNPEFELFNFFERTPDLVCIAGKDGFFKNINPALINKLGYTDKELYTSPIEFFIYEDDKEHTRINRELLLKDKVLHNFINRYVAKNRDIIWLEWTSLYFSESEIVLAIAKDITKRKNNEKEAEEKYAKFKDLTSQFKSTIEEDRKYFAHELHEELAQLAAVIKLDVSWMDNYVTPLPDSYKTRIQHAVMVSELLIRKIKKISFSISPNMLDFFGLKHTLELLCRDFSVLNGIMCVFANNYDEGRLTHEMKIDFFRICQESLTIITDRAGACKVKIIMEDIGDKIQLTILSDNNLVNVEHTNRTTSFAGIKRRVASMSGHLNILALPEGGTKICVLALCQS